MDSTITRKRPYDQENSSALLRETKRRTSPRLLEFLSCGSCTLLDVQCVFDPHEATCRACQAASRMCLMPERNSIEQLIDVMKTSPAPGHSSIESFLPPYPRTRLRMEIHPQFVSNNTFSSRNTGKSDPGNVARAAFDFNYRTNTVPKMITAEESKPNISDLISSTMDANEVIVRLGNHDCPNISSNLDYDANTSIPISTGGFGDVYRGSLKSGSTVAIKTMRVLFDSSGEGQKNLKRTARELHTWSKCRHPNILPLYGLVLLRGQVGMVSPWMKRGNLREYISKNPGVDRCLLSAGVCRGLEYLHKTDIVHGDLKALNILVSDEEVPMLMDFGNAVLKERTLQFTRTTSHASISPRWTSPEILSGQTTCTKAGDIYALGMTMLEIFTGEIPYPNKGDQAVMFAVGINKETPQRPQDEIPVGNVHGDRLWSLLMRCWEYEAERRPSIETVAVTMDTISYKELSGIQVL